MIYVNIGKDTPLERESERWRNALPYLNSNEHIC